ncbi:NAD-dependent epimerase/dehydratase family protein [Bacillus haikouensis]|uniref:NAD-dependent epimerase/dehydratase family protein n=1 Tax=Bacillus haikouensis TaxID=1510468 RepID=UPI0015570C1D|nr:NAD-dependent epimerase/dehydratase family protein [Bacillus haikouensis]NQD64949.1 NAD-dependent epimerase/dehydratase family protein [Bacillus haikouensis]
MKVIVTGGAGFIGSHLVDALIDRGDYVHVIDNLSSGKIHHINPSAKFHEIELTSPKVIDLIDKIKPEYVFHLAAQADVSKSTLFPLEDLKANVAGTVNILEACRVSGVKKIIFSSTSAVYGNTGSEMIKEDTIASPISFYGLSKLTAEYYIKLYHESFSIPYTILRYGNVYGPRQTSKGEGGVIAVFLEKLKNKEKLKVNGDGLQTRDFIYVGDVVSANIAASNSEVNATMQISTGCSTSVLQLIDLIKQIHPLPVEYYHSHDRFGDIKHSCLDNRLAIKTLNWEPVHSIGEGIRKTYQSFH